ncbi:MAG: phosphoribosyl-AMP cyclohydrolase [Leptospiraceae bacterium]|nr:phosphoribosyl-AMP cyclohydrolase [Leptospiraceae bacterium]
MVQIVLQDKKSGEICGIRESNEIPGTDYWIDCDEDSLIVKGDFPSPKKQIIRNEIPVFSKDLLPVCAYDEECNVLMQAFVNKNAIELSLKEGSAHYFSRSRNKMWKKGEESGHIQKIRKILFLPDYDLFLYEVDQKSAACHTGHYSCFYRLRSGKEELIVSEKIFEPGKVYKNP